ncbi:hypothetical protein F4779DRAFT_621122 [Xylariaceae sp. FL0662B]|nr:hypothetical protein F4779DRAFT_621122 [Xylariaceae sp. FL0662B]
MDSQPNFSPFPGFSLNADLPTTPDLLPKKSVKDNREGVQFQQSFQNSKMKAAPQYPGSSGSYGTKRRISIPRLGDGLHSILGDDFVTAKSNKPVANHEFVRCLEDPVSYHTSVVNRHTESPISSSWQQTPSTATITPSRSDQTSLSGETEVSELETPLCEELSTFRQFKFNTSLNATSLEKHGDAVQPGNKNVTNCTGHTILSTTADRTGSWVDGELDIRQSPLSSDDNSFSGSISVASSEGVRLSSPATIPSAPRDRQISEPFELSTKPASRKTSSPLAPTFRPKTRSITQSHDKPMLALHLSSAVSVEAQGQFQRRRSTATEDNFNSTPYSQAIYTPVENTQRYSTASPPMPACPAPQDVASISDSVEGTDIVRAVDEICVSYFAGKITLPQAVEVCRSLRQHRKLDKKREYGAQSAVNEAQQSHHLQTLLTTAPNDLVPSNSSPCLGQVYPPQNADMRMILEAKLASYARENTAPASERATKLHIFVDMSNIFIGFCDSYKISRRIPLQQWIKAPRFSFKIFAYIMERARDVEKRVLASSIGSPAGRRVQWPSYFLEAEQLKYEMNIFDRVQKEKISPNNNRSRRRGKISPRGLAPSYSYEVATTSADESTEEGMALAYETRNAEQGVDENLHLNMMNSMMDCMSNPGTMVLATGDAAQAEFSDGFMQYAIRALTMGWKLELVTWKKTISSAWTSPDFLGKYGDRFQVIYLDEFIEELQSDILA